MRAAVDERAPDDATVGADGSRGAAGEPAPVSSGAAGPVGAPPVVTAASAALEEQARRSPPQGPLTLDGVGAPPAPHAGHEPATAPIRVPVVPGAVDVSRLLGEDEPAHVPFLHRLDRRVVPMLQRGARAVARVLGWPLRVVDWIGDHLLGRRVSRFLAGHPGMIAFAAGLVLVGGTAIHMQRRPILDQEAADAAARAREQTVTRPGESSPGASVLPGASTSIGPPLGAEVATYVAERHEALSALAASVESDVETVAVVSFTRRITPAAVAQVLDDVGEEPVDVELLVAQFEFPGDLERPLQTEVVAADLAGSLGRALSSVEADLAEEEANTRQLLESGTLDAPEFEADLRARLAEIATAQELIDEGGRVIFAVVVRAPIGWLAAAVDQEVIRLVDVAEAEIDPETASFFGLRPGDANVTTFGRLG